jgi:hypothetical protein
MVNSLRASALGATLILVLAACGGRPDDAPARSEANAPLSVSAMPASRSATPLRDAAQMSAASVAASEATLPELRQEVALLRREVADVRQQLARLPGAATGAEIPANPRTDPDARLEAQRQEALRIASSESAFRSEQNDARWSREATANVRAAFAQADDTVSTQVRSVECRSQSCRVEINAAAGESLARDLPIILSHLGDALPHMTAGKIDQGDGRQATVLYMTR